MPILLLLCKFCHATDVGGHQFFVNCFTYIDNYNILNMHSKIILLAKVKAVDLSVAKGGLGLTELSQKKSWSKLTQYSVYIKWMKAKLVSNSPRYNEHEK